MLNEIRIIKTIFVWKLLPFSWRVYHVCIPTLYITIFSCGLVLHYDILDIKKTYNVTVCLVILLQFLH
jgi:hypothetical protein